MGLSPSTVTIYEDDCTKPPSTSVVLSYMILAVVSGFLIGTEVSEQLKSQENKSGELSMSYYEFAMIIVFLQALVGAVRFGKFNFLPPII